jgi:hypothetical protein
VSQPASAPVPAEHDTIGWLIFWLNAALRCPEFHWDEDQAACAEGALAQALFDRMPPSTSTTPSKEPAGAVATSKADDTNFVQAIEYAVHHGWPKDAHEWLERIARGVRARALAAPVVAIDVREKAAAGAQCPTCGAPCSTTVNERGGENGWSTTDAERTVYHYVKK